MVPLSCAAIVAQETLFFRLLGAVAVFFSALALLLRCCIERFDWLDAARPGLLLVDRAGIHRHDAERTTTLASFDEPFGVTIFSSPDRALFRIALTSASAARYLAAQVRDAEDAALAPTLIAHAVTVSDDDLRAPSGAALTAGDAEKLLRAIVDRAPQALEQIFLSDSNGEAVTVGTGELCVGPRRIDLLAPLEWRASVFQEALPQTAAFYQATWIRQADLEVVFVAPVASEGTMNEEPAAAVCAAGLRPLVRRSLSRDLRLLQAPPEKPPPHEYRHAIDRPFMLPLRRAVDGAPRPSRAERPLPHPASRTA
ncbi:MAG TPA: hypothetical protein VK841_18330 [Polyangiaceae bacterium]|jgi:hypothetical protein|nr:hypothetical protein [Polyangiaceae bacterium]